VHLTPGERAAVVDGEEGKRRHQVYLRWAPDRRNALWEADHKELPVLVMAPRAQQPRKPWVTLFVEAYSRLIMGWALSMTPNAGVVLAALRRGIVVDAERGPFGGLPEKLRPDNGLEFVANALGRSCAALGVELAPTPPYKPYAKGKVERVNRTLETCPRRSPLTSSRTRWDGLSVAPSPPSGRSTSAPSLPGYASIATATWCEGSALARGCSPRPSATRCTATPPAPNRSARDPRERCSALPSGSARSTHRPPTPTMGPTSPCGIKA